MTFKGGLQPLRLSVGVALTVGIATRDAVLLGIRGWDNTWMMGVEIEPATILGGEGHVTGYARDLRLVPTDNVIRVALRVMVEGALSVAVAAFEAWCARTTMDMVTNGAGDAVLDRIQGALMAGIDGGLGGVAEETTGGHFPIAAVITILQVPEAIGVSSPPPGCVLLVALTFTSVAPPGGGVLTERGLGRSEVASQGRTGPVTVPAVGGVPAGIRTLNRFSSIPMIYANVATAPLHEPALNAIKETHQAGRPLWISRQVLCEFIAARIRPQTFTHTSRLSR